MDFIKFKIAEMTSKITMQTYHTVVHHIMVYLSRLVVTQMRFFYVQYGAMAPFSPHIV